LASHPFVCVVIHRLPRSSLFPYTTLFRSSKIATADEKGSHRTSQNGNGNNGQRPSYTQIQLLGLIFGPLLFVITLLFFRPVDLSDRKSTRLNSSHVSISYAVFCLKKKIKY